MDTAFIELAFTEQEVEYLATNAMTNNMGADCLDRVIFKNNLKHHSWYA